jgi:hypothetical protein
MVTGLVTVAPLAGTSTIMEGSAASGGLGLLGQTSAAWAVVHELNETMSRRRVARRAAPTKKRFM